MNANPDLTVILSTYNRAEVLRSTLEAFCRLDRREMDVEFVVVDNASTDATAEVVRELATRLPLRYLFEPQAGKNRAVNRALREVPLGEIVVFTDDDVVPRPDWLAQILAVSRRSPAYSIFGGRIDLLWPERGAVPGWAREIARQGWAMAAHRLADREMPYPADRAPVGPNFWVRRSLFDQGHRFGEAIGPTPRRGRKMGGETSFLLALADAGFPSLYSPHAVVEHRVHPHLLEEAGMLRRAVSSGRGGARIRFLRGKMRPGRFPLAWMALRLASLLRYELRYALAGADGDPDRRMLARIEASVGIGWNRECLLIGFERLRGDDRPLVPAGPAAR